MSFTAADGQTLAGALLGSGDVAVVLAHQSDGDVCQWLGFAEYLSAQDYLALPFDLRGFGSSYGSTGHEDLDVAAAVSEARRRGAHHVILVGASLGGAASVVAAAAIAPPVDGVISISGPARFEDLDARQAARNLTVPVAFLAGTGDRRFAGGARAMYRACESSGKQLVLYPSAEHGVALLEGPGGNRVKTFILTFLRDHTST